MPDRPGAAIIWAHVEEPPTRLTLLRPDLPPAVDEVFARVLAKQPGDRYENCREFVGAARQALGMADVPASTNATGGLSRRVLRPAPPVADYQEVAHDPHGAHDTHAAPDPHDAHDAHGVHTGLRVMTTSIARPTSLPHDNLPARPALAPVPEWSPPYLSGGRPLGGFPGLGGPGRPTSADDLGGPDDPAGSGDHGDDGDHDDHDDHDGHGGHGGRAAGRRPARDRSERRLPVLLLALAFALTAGIGITLGSWLGFPGKAASGQRPGASSPAAPAGSASAAAAVRTPATGASLTPPTLPATPPKTLRQALALVNATVWTTGFLPPKSCTFASAVSARCSDPYPGITVAFFQNYSSPDALYQAYEAAIKQANNGRFVVNTQDCGASAPPKNGGEISWNHFGLHTPAYSIQQLETGKLNAASQAAGRMFCNYNSTTNTENIIWTETDGNLLGEVTGSPHLAVWNWWLHVHHNIAFNGQPMGAMNMAPSAFPKA
jgi:hypothetical protein